MLSAHEWMLLAVVGTALAAIASGRIRADLVALLVLVTLPITGVINFEEALSGFSRSVVITIIGLFMITQGLEDTGVVKWIAGRLRQVGGNSEVRLLLLFMVAGATLSLVMNNIAAGAVLLPAAVQVARDAKVPSSKLLMPMGFGTLVGGMATYFTTANIILSSILRDQGQARLSMIDFVPTGGLIVLTSLIYMALIGRRLLPKRESVTVVGSSPDLYEAYQLDERLWEARVPPDSKLNGQNLKLTSIGEALGVTVLGIVRRRQMIVNPGSTEVVQPYDCLLVLGREERVQEMDQWGIRVEKANGDYHPDLVEHLNEVIIPPRSRAVGKSLADIQFRNRYGLTAVALWREGRSIRTDVGKTPLDVGDALLMSGPAIKVAQLAKERDFLVLQSGVEPPPPIPHKAKWALGITVLVLLLSIFEITPTAEAMMIGAAAMALTGCINLDEAYLSIEWRVIFLIAGMLPISIAMVRTGLAERVGQGVVDVVGPMGPLALVSGLFVLTMVITQFIGGQVAALIVGPIAVTSALELGVNPQAVAVAVAIACSTSFLTPIAHPVNVLMMGPGGYRFSDFPKVGAGMTLVTFVTLLVGMVLFWSL
ncbi:MAG TPA: SLC13 family permease [Aggregatilineaceae bacterium]|nr:SLC13 family permease [Aggregatilineaceae bacterium]